MKPRPVQRQPGDLFEVLDRVLDKGVVIDAYFDVSVVGLRIASVDTRIIVASIETYLDAADAVSRTQAVARPSVPLEKGPEDGRRPRPPPGPVNRLRDSFGPTSFSDPFPF